MIIQGPDYKMTLCNGHSWDLELLHESKSKSGEGKSEFKVYGYGMSMESCLKRIIHYRMDKKVSVLDLKGYLDEYNKLLKELKTTIHGEEENL